jgi:hypothetical protein
MLEENHLKTPRNNFNKTKSSPTKNTYLDVILFFCCCFDGLISNKIKQKKSEQ